VEVLDRPQIHTAGTAGASVDMFAGVLNRDASEILALKNRCAALEERLEKRNG